MYKNFRPQARIGFLRIAFSLLTFLVLFRLFYIQIIKNKDYEAKASDQHMFSTIINSKRGDIISSDGYPLATSKTSYILYAEPKKIKDAKDTARILAPIILDDILEASESAKYLTGVDNYENLKNITSELEDKLSKNLFWISLKKSVGQKAKEEIEKNELLGIGFEEERVRYYPEKTLASHILGFVAGSETEEIQGYFGLEGYFDGDLKGKSGKIIEERGAGGSTILFGGYKKTHEQDGRNVEITIDRRAQFMVEERLKKGVEKYKAEKGTVIVVNPITGDILAMANYPSFEPSKYYEESNEEKEIKILKTNVSIGEIFEPGSILKPLTVSAAMDLKLMDPNTTFNDEGPVYYSGYRIDNWDGKHHGVQTITQLLEKSNNIGAAFVGTTVGRDNLYNYLKKFGLDEISGITLEGEETGHLRDPKQWTDIDLATVSFGQGVSATALQMVMAFSVFDNGGILVKPRIVSKIYDDQRVIELPVEHKRRVISSETAAAMTTMLTSAAEKGEAKYFNVRDYSVAGKTGTAQIPEDGKYNPNKTNATFVGFLPNAPIDRKLVMIVRLEKPETSIYAAETAVPLWMDILRDLVVLYKIPPDKL